MIKMPKENMSKVFFNLEVGQGLFFFLTMIQSGCNQRQD